MNHKYFFMSVFIANFWHVNWIKVSLPFKYSSRSVFKIPLWGKWKNGQICIADLEPELTRTIWLGNHPCKTNTKNVKNTVSSESDISGKPLKTLIFSSSQKSPSQPLNSLSDFLKNLIIQPVSGLCECKIWICFDLRFSPFWSETKKAGHTQMPL